VDAYVAELLKNQQDLLKQGSRDQATGKLLQNAVIQALRFSLHGLGSPDTTSNCCSLLPTHPGYWTQMLVTRLAP